MAQRVLPKHRQKSSKILFCGDMKDIERIEKIVRHITNVQENCLVLGKKLIEAGETHLGRQLIANGFIHDNSKFYGVEWEHLDHYAGGEGVDKEKLGIAVSNHNALNKHHPEAWGDIRNMPRVYIAEMCCDWAARASEFGSSVYDWVQGNAMKRYKFTRNQKVYKEIMYFMNLLLDQPFKQVAK
jgi:hypothetical protein